MSKPTQAQIEAAANELRQYALSLVGKEWNIEYVARRILTAAAETQDAAYKRGFEDCQQGRTNKYAAITAAAEVGEHTGMDEWQDAHNAKLQFLTAADPALCDFIRDTPISEPNDGWAAEVGNTQKVVEGYNAGWRAAFESTIERCARVADMQARSSNWQWADAAEAIAAAIRALKD